MITKFKIFESVDTDDLIRQFDSDFIEEYYDEHTTYSIDDVIEVWPDIIKGYIDDERYVKDFIHDEINSREFSEFDEYDYKKYIENNLTDIKKDFILKTYKENNDIDENEETEYEDYMLDELDEDELKDVISEDNEEYEFVEGIVKSWYDGRTALEIIDEMNGKLTGEELYNIVRNYIDEDAAIQEYKDNEDYTYKKEKLESSIERETELQQYLLNKDKKNALALAELFTNNTLRDNIGDNYDFQKAYIEEYVKDNIYEDATEEEIKEESPDLRARALYFLDDNFTLDPDIEKEYYDDMWMITAKKYNI